MRRYFYIAAIALVTIVVASFKFQNIESATISLFTMSLTLPLSLLVMLVYFLGMLTGGFVLGLLRSWTHAATQIEKLEASK
jgi:uncharacterized integral membrane protein